MSKENLEDIKKENIREVESDVHISESYSNYGAYVLDGRALPSMVDGLKNVERRVLWVMLNYPNGKIEKSSAIEGDALKLHPHGSTYGSLVKMANTDPSFIKTQGNFGGRDFGASAHRYTSAGLNKFAYLNYKYYKSSDMKEGELDGYTEPVSIPCLLSYGFLDGSEGLGSGISSKLPKLDPIGMIKAIKEFIVDKKITNYPLIDMNNVEVTTSIEDVKNISRDGRGLIRFRGKVEVNPEDWKELILYYRPDRVPEHKLVNTANSLGVEFTNLGTHYVFRIPKRSRVSMDDLKAKVLKATTASMSFNLSLYKDATAYLTNFESSISEQLKYLRHCIKVSINRDLEKSIRQLKLLNAIKNISNDEYLMANLHRMDVDKILEFCSNFENYEESVYKEALGKPIRALSKDHSDEIKKLEVEIENLKSNLDSANIDNHILSLYDELEDYLVNEYKYINKTSYIGG